MRNPLPVVNAKTIEFDRPGAGTEGYDITPQNIGAKYLKLWANRENPSGGSKQIVDAIVGNTDRSLRRSPKSAITKQFKQFLADGKWPANPSIGFLRYAGESIDYGLRETGRSAQHKQGFLQSFLGQLVVLVAEVAAGFIPVVGPYVSMAIGAAAGYVKDKSVLGAVVGGVTGYGAGTIGASIANGGIGKAWTAFTAPANGAGITATGGGTGIANVLNNAGAGIVGSGASGVVSALGTGVSLIAAGKAVSNASKGGGTVKIPTLNTRPDSPVDPNAITRQAAATAGKARVTAGRAARGSSWLAMGAHTGAGDPRNLGLKSPQARPTADVVRAPAPVPRATDRGYAPVTRRPVDRPRMAADVVQIPVARRRDDSLPPVPRRMVA